MNDFQFAMTGNVTDAELVQLAAAADDGGACRCLACTALRQFLTNPQQLVVIIPCSRIDRLHLHRSLGGLGDIAYERHGGSSAMLVKKLQTHAHVEQFGEQYATIYGQQGKLSHVKSRNVHHVRVEEKGHYHGQSLKIPSFKFMFEWWSELCSMWSMWYLYVHCNSECSMIFYENPSHL